VGRSRRLDPLQTHFFAHIMPTSQQPTSQQFQVKTSQRDGQKKKLALNTDIERGLLQVSLIEYNS